MKGIVKQVYFLCFNMKQINHVKIRIPDLFLHLQTLGDVRKDTIRKYYNKGKGIRNKLYKYNF